MAQEITLTVNGTVHHLHIDPDTPLLYVLRNDLGFKSAKFGCGLGQCGACSVLIDGQARPSCRTPVGSVENCNIVTVEGLGTPDNLHPVQRAFIAEGAAQCGFCTSGMVITAVALLERTPHPSEDQIRTALSSNLCRCGTYDRVRRAVQRAAQEEAGSSLYTVREQPATGGPSQSDRSLPRTLLHTNDIDAWLRIHADGTVTLFTGKVELGQDLRTSIAMIGADELDLSLDRIQVVMADTGRSPNEGYTASSMSLETSGNAVRHAAAEAKRIMLSVAHEELEAPLERLVVDDGTITDPFTGRSVTYWELYGDKRFGGPVTGTAAPKGSDAYQIVGHPQESLDIVAKVTGQAHFVHDLDLPGMVHGRILRPPAYDARLVAIDETPVTDMPGVIEIVRDGRFVGLLAEREEQAVHALEALQAAATWDNATDLPPQEALFEYLLDQPHQPQLVVDGMPVEGPVPPIEAPPDAAHTLSATYYRPYHAHASLGPSAAVALLEDGKLTVWTHSQGVYPIRAGIALVLDMPEETIRCIHADGPGCYGHNGADDVALDAALLARTLPGRPVSVKWTRSDENAWEPYGAATAIQMQGSLDAQGNVIDWNHDVWGYTHLNRPRPTADVSGLLAAWHLEEPFSPAPEQTSMGHEVGIHRNATPLYTFSRCRIVKHFVSGSPLRVSALRGLGSYANTFAIESFVDELAQRAGEDPVAFRLRYLADQRARAVVDAAFDKAGWQPRARPRLDGHGRGFAFSQYKNRQCYVAVVIDLDVDRESGQIHLERAVIAADVGQIVNPAGLSNQLEGACLQSASWTLCEEVTFDRHGITSLDWRSYPILRSRDAPQIETVLLNQPGQPWLGVGEGAMGPTPAAIANAIYDAVGVRLRQTPFTPERVRAEMRALDARG
jgi:CO/xanthine dehydrogenase Mo-binding subunit/aerobic-type carbon monoxide dehydrogenase small subunit (CoxS/CutS family)